MSGELRTSANLSMLYADLPVDDRPAAAAGDGFEYVESWWPFDTPAPEEGRVDSFCRALNRAGVQLVALNLDTGDPRDGERGLLSIPRHVARVESNLEAAADVVARTGCRIVNALYGNRVPDAGPGEQDRLALRQVVRVADRLGGLDATVVIETLNLVDSPHYPLTDIAASAAFVRRANAASRRGNVRLLLDTYHLATMGTDPAAAVRDHGPLIGHVQFADFPGRGRPGTGEIDFAAVEKELHAAGYGGFVGHEYHPKTGEATA